MKRIAILTGGDSAEKVISLQSADVVRKHLARSYDCYLIHIYNDDWYFEDNGLRTQINKDDFSLAIDDTIIKFDAVFFAIHGTPAEDGKIQGYFDMLAIPYNTSGVLASSLTFNKKACNEFLNSYSILSAKSVVIYQHKTFDVNEIIETVGLPCFVKPNNGGSSFGASKVNELNELTTAIDHAFVDDQEVIIEEFIDGIEITCGVFISNGKTVVLPITEIATDNDFFDYEAKYEGKSDEITPARISEDIRDDCWRLTKMIYELLDCKGIARLDYFIKEDQLYLIEVNTIPGLSEVSLVPQQVVEHGMSLQEFFEIQIKEALT